MPTRRKKVTRANGRKRAARRPYAKLAKEYQELMQQLGLNQLETGKLLGYAGRTSRRYKRGEGKTPLAVVKLMRLMASGALSKQQVMQA